MNRNLCVAAFVLGAMACALLVNFARRRHLCSTYALPLMLEAALILVFGAVVLLIAGALLSAVYSLRPGL